MILPSPYPYFGGKRLIANTVWEALGNPQLYLEPFLGSAAVLLARPGEPPYKAEVVNDLDGFLTNFWRAIQADPDGVADYAIDQVNEIDLLARHRWLCERERKTAFIERMRSDPDYYDCKIAGWWCWGLCAWIGSGWCAGWYDGPEGAAVSSQPPHLGRGRKVGIHRDTAAVSEQGQSLRNGGGQGITSKTDASSRRPQFSSGGAGLTGIHRRNHGDVAAKRPVFDNGARGVQRDGHGEDVWNQRPPLGDKANQCLNRQEHDIESSPDCAQFPNAWKDHNHTREYLRALRDRIKPPFRCCCGDWERITTEGATSWANSIGCFLDPPYAAKTGRDMTIYNHEATDDLNSRVQKFCLDHGDDPRWRIVLAGYSGEYDLPGWREIAWKAGASMQTRNSAAAGTGNAQNRGKERLWLSPHCLGANQTNLFGDGIPTEIEIEDEPS